MGALHPLVQRTASLFTRDNEAVRLEVHQGPGRLRLAVHGPGDVGRTVDFTSESSLAAYQLAYEEALLDTGFHLQAVAERRASADQLVQVSKAVDRRR